MRRLPLAMLLVISMSWGGCKTRVISADALETPLAAGKTFTPQADGWYMTETRYQRYRRAVADKIMELQIQAEKDKPK
jgi:hypothetical protein